MDEKNRMRFCDPIGGRETNYFDHETLEGKTVGFPTMGNRSFPGEALENPFGKNSPCARLAKSQCGFNEDPVIAQLPRD